MEEFGVMLAIGFVVLLNVLLKKFVRGIGQQQGRAEQEREFEATPEEVREFLEEMRAGPGQPLQAPGVPPTPAEPARARPAFEHPAPILLEEAKPAPAPMPFPARVAPLVSQPPAAAAPRKRKKPRASRAARPSPATPGASATPRAIPAAVHLARFDLRRAVIWSEILRPPVSMRPRVGHRPPSRKR